MTFKSFDDVIKFSIENIAKDSGILSETLRCDINIIQEKQRVGSLSFTWNIDKEKINMLRYGGEYFTKNTASMKEQAEKAKWPAEEFITFADKNPHLIFKLDSTYGSLIFVKEDPNTYRLVKYILRKRKLMTLENDIWNLMMGSAKDMALLLINEYGVEDFYIALKNTESPYFIDGNKGYCVIVNNLEAAVFAMADKNTIYPICAGEFIHYYEDKGGKKGIYPSDYNQFSTPSMFFEAIGVTSVSEWIFDGLRGEAYRGPLENEITY
jgi:hypothetical protein